MRIRPFDPDAADDDVWSGYHRFRRTLAAETDPTAPVGSDAEGSRALRRSTDLVATRYFLGFEAERVVGFFRLQAQEPDSPEYATNRQLVGIRGNVLKEFRRRGLAREFLETAVLPFMIERGATVAETSTADPDGHLVLTALGFEKRSAQVPSSLDLTTVDRALVRRWTAEGERANRGVRAVILTPRIPEDRLTAWARAYTELVNDVPFDDLDHGDIVMTPDSAREWYARLEAESKAHATAMLTQGDTIIALSDAEHALQEPERIGQRFTGVRRDRRGRGLARYVKALLLDHILDTLPTAATIDTENAATNDRMLDINRRLGFRSKPEKGIYQADLDTLQRRLDR